jgi:hypothetical protein
MSEQADLRRSWTVAVLVCFVVNLVPALLAAIVLKKSAGQIAEPYFALVAIQIVATMLAWRLRKWEERGGEPARVAFGWALMVAFLSCGAIATFVYSAAEFRLLDVRANWDVILFAGIATIFVSGVSMYYQSLPRLVARASKRIDPR